MLGKGSLGKFAITEPAGANVIAAVLAIAGIGTFSPVLNGIPAAVLSISGAGATSFVGNANGAAVLSSAGVGVAAIVLHSFDGAVFSSAGTSTSAFPGSRIDNRVLAIAGVSTFNSFTYSFFIDAERACVHEEPRVYNAAPEYRIAIIEFDPNRHPDAIVATVPFENRTAIIPFENRVYQVGAEQRGAPTPNRQRTC